MLSPLPTVEFVYEINPCPPVLLFTYIIKMKKFFWGNKLETHLKALLSCIIYCGYLKDKYW